MFKTWTLTAQIVIEKSALECADPVKMKRSMGEFLSEHLATSLEALSGVIDVEIIGSEEQDGLPWIP